MLPEQPAPIPEVQHYEQMLKDQDQTIAGLNDRIRTMEAEATALRTTVANALHTQVTNLADLSAQIQSLTAEAQALRAQRSQLDDDLQTADIENQRLHVELEALKASKRRRRKTPDMQPALAAT